MAHPLELYTYADLARLWRVSVRTIKRWVKRAGIPRAYRRIGRPAKRVALMRGDHGLEVLRRARPALFEGELTRKRKSTCLLSLAA